MAIKPKKVVRTTREKRKIRLRKHLIGTDARPRVCVYKSCKHTYVQIISDDSGKTLVSAATNEPAVIERIKSATAPEGINPTKSSKGSLAAWILGQVIAERSQGANIKSVVFDRNGFLYHGRIKAVADGARQGGLEF